MASVLDVEAYAQGADCWFNISGSFDTSKGIRFQPSEAVSILGADGVKLTPTDLHMQVKEPKWYYFLRVWFATDDTKHTVTSGGMQVKATSGPIVSSSDPNKPVTMTVEGPRKSGSQQPD